MELEHRFATLHGVTLHFVAAGEGEPSRFCTAFRKPGRRGAW